MKNVKLVVLVAVIAATAGCATTNSVPYKSSISNVIEIQNTFQSKGVKISVGSFSMGAGVEENLVCRLMGPVTVSPGKGLATYIKEALQEELFLAQVYSSTAPNVIEGKIEKLAFSSVSPANWEISMRVSSNNSAGYTTSVKYNYDTSFDAVSACKNVADAFAPAVQELIKQVVANPQFATLAKLEGAVK